MKTKLGAAFGVAFQEKGIEYSSAQYRLKRNLGLVDFKVSKNPSEIFHLDDGRYACRLALPCAKGYVVNITIFGKRKFLARIRKGQKIKVFASVTEKGITRSDGSTQDFYNLDLNLVHPSSETRGVVGVAMEQNMKAKEERSWIKKKRTEGKLFFKTPQGGYITREYYKK